MGKNPRRAIGAPFYFRKSKQRLAYSQSDTKHMGQRRFDVALFLLSATLFGGCAGGGGGAAPPGAQVLPPAPGTPQPSSGPVTYLQSSGSLATTGTILGGTHQALIAVISGSSHPQPFAGDTLTVGTSAGAQTAARAGSARREVPAPRIDPVEAFPADDTVLARKVQGLAVNGGASPIRRAQSVLPANPSVGTSALIWVQKGALGGSRVNVQVPATLAAQTPHTNLWIDGTLQLTQSEIAQIGADAENAYASDTAHFAAADYPASAPGLQPQYSACGVGGSVQGTTAAYIQEPADRRIDVMVVNSSNLGGLGGYFSAANLMTQATLNCLNGSSTTYESNGAPFIFVGWFASSGTTYDLQEDLVRSTAHELQHLINFVNHAILAPGAVSSSFNGNEEPYVNEGLSMLAQDLAVASMYGSRGVQFDADDALSRASVYLGAPSKYSLSGFSGVDPASWGGNGSAQFNCGGGCYGAAYLFQRYLRDRFGGDAYTHAMETSGFTAEDNLQSSTGESASSLFGDFALAMAAGSLHVASTDARFAFGSLDLTGAYTDQFGASVRLGGLFATPYSGASVTVNAPVGGFAFVNIGSVPAAGTKVTVSDNATAFGFALEGGLAQK